MVDGTAMAIWNSKSTLTKAVDDWQAKGFLDAVTAARLHADIISNIKPRSFSSIVMLLGVICLAFGIMTFVGANWEEMTSHMRVMLLFVSLWASWGISVWFKSVGKDWAAQVFVLLACAIFGASIMLIGQIYHIQGEPKEAVWLWAVGTGLAALVTRSIPALVLYVILITTWTVIDFQFFGRPKMIDYSYIAYWLLGAATAWWLTSRFAAHMLAIGLIFWLFYVVIQFIELSGSSHDMRLLFSILGAAFVGISISLYSYGSLHWLRGFETPALVYLMILIAGLIFIWYMASDQHWDGSWRISTVTYIPAIVAVLATLAISYVARQQQNVWRYDIMVSAVFSIIFLVLSGSITRVPFIMEAFMLALSIWTIRMGWRIEYRPLSTLGFLGFASVMLLIYFQTLGNLLDTSLFYLGAGVLLLTGAAVLPRLMRRKIGQGAAT